MATGRYFLITFNFDAEPKTDELVPVFDLAIDWIRYSSNCWIVWTTSEPVKWFERLKPKLGPKDHMLIVAIDLSCRQGWLPRSVWDWIKKPRQ